MYDTMTKKERVWCAIGDSFTYLDSHCDETGDRLHKGYLTRTLEQLPACIELVNLGINGSATSDWLSPQLPAADFYTVLLGTNDWMRRHTPIGTETDFQGAVPGTVLGNLGSLVRCIRGAAPSAPVFMMNPVERGEFVYLFDHENHGHGSDRPEEGQWLRDIACRIYTCVRGEQIIPIDLHTLSGFTPEHAVRFKQVLLNGQMRNLTYGEYRDLPEFNPKTDPYPYPKDAILMTYDGLHPSDQGAQAIADVLAREIRRYYEW